MNERKKFIDTPSQTAGPFLHIGCTPRIIGIDIFRNVLGQTPFEEITDDEAINIKGKIFDGNNEPIIDAMIETWQCDENGKVRVYFKFPQIYSTIQKGQRKRQTYHPHLHFVIANSER